MWRRIPDFGRPRLALGRLRHIISIDAYERIIAGVTHQRQQAVRPLAEVNRMTGEEHLHAGGDNADRTARITRCKCTSPASAPARTTMSPMIISTTAAAARTEAPAPAERCGEASVRALRRQAKS